MTQGHSTRAASTLWILLLTLASTATTLVFACATPFPALAALAAVHMRRSDGIWLMLAAWLASQAVGFCLLDYPRDAGTFGWAAGLATAAVASVIGAHVALRLAGHRPVPVRLALAYLAGFVAFKAVVLGWAFFLGGVASTIDPAILQRQFLRNGAILVGLYALYRLLTAIGVPQPAPRVATA
jgi:hypothetical protein